MISLYSNRIFFGTTAHFSRGIIHVHWISITVSCVRLERVWGALYECLNYTLRYRTTQRASVNLSVLHTHLIWWKKLLYVSTSRCVCLHQKAVKLCKRPSDKCYSKWKIGSANCLCLYTFTDWLRTEAWMQVRALIIEKNAVLFLPSMTTSVYPLDC